MTHRRLLIIVVFLAIFSFGLARNTDIDFWWHLQTGELIAQSGAIPTVDPFSYSAVGRPWVVHEWLWDLGVFQLYSRGGYVLTVLLSALLVTLAYAILYRLLRRLGANELLSSALTLWAAAMALPNLGVRPRELTHLFLAFYLSRLLLYRTGQVRHLWLLPLVMVLWVNTHGAFVLGIGLLLLVIAGETLGSLRSGDRMPRHLWLVGLATLAAATVNPHGLRMLLYPVNYYLAAENPSFSIVTEFQSPNFHDPLFLLFAAGVVALMVMGERRRRLNYTDVLVIAAFTLQAFVSARQVSVCALVLAPYLALRICERFPLARTRPAPQLWRGFIVVNWLVLPSLLIAGGVYIARPQVWREVQLGSEPNPGLMPVAGAGFIETHGLPDPVFNHQPWGGYLIDRWYPSRRVFIDGRIDMYGPDITREYTQVVTIKPEWSEVLDKYGVQTVLIPTQSPLSLLLIGDDRWDHVFRGEIEDVFRRVEKPENAARAGSSER